ncbi:FAD-binding oxidoreductase [Gemmatimonas phototrophica]|uniref:FAD-binding oxidoreductase n=1 Tax=Gemmatimonas phototrophica TaxID=1379270 RepID=UPI0006A74651|nr:FAD-binding oxidoreductase [Gemmatimonas phototrophica]
MKRISELAQQIGDTQEPLRIEGSGTWLEGGGPWAPAQPLPTRHLRGVVEYEPGDLVITVGAGTTLEELSAITGEHAQMLALAPYGDTTATVGAAVATASYGPLTYGDYTMRDLVLGLQVITGAGDITRVGGRVVKNVAGFDLVRLHTGAYGTLGVITEVSLRLHASPALDDIYMGTVPNAAVGGVDDLIPRIVAQRAPLPMLLRFAPDTAPQLWARVSGNAARAAALLQLVRSFGVEPPSVMAPSSVHESLRHTPANTVVLRARTHRSDAVPFVRAALDAFPLATLLYDPAHGSLRVIVPAHAAGAVERDIATWYRLAAAGGAMHTMSVVMDQGRHTTTPRIPLDDGVKRALDPRDLLNRLAPVQATSLAHPDV